MNQTAELGWMRPKAQPPMIFAQSELTCQRAAFGEEQDRHPEEVKIGEMQDFAVQIIAPRPVDTLGEKQAGNQEKVRHPEGAGPFDEAVQPSQLPCGFFDAER